MRTDLPALGVGLGFRDPFLGELFLEQSAVDFLEQSAVDFLEITADHFLGAPAAGGDALALLADHFPLIPHGLNLSLGSAEGLDPGHVGRLAALVDRLDPPWWSEHIAFTRAGGVEIGHLAPLPFTREAVDVLCRNVAAVRRQIAAPLILENITSPFTLPGAEMTEGQFLAEVTARTGCGLLLDVTNLYTNAVNHGGDPDRVLDDMPLERAVQLHFVGGEWAEGVLIDSHSRPAPPEVWALLEEVVARAPVRGIILERDENLPPLSELTAELARARGIGRRHGRWA